MGTAAKPTREPRTLPGDGQNDTTDFQRLGEGQVFGACALAFLLALGLQRAHKAPWQGGGGLTRHSHSVRVRLGGVPSWRRQCTPGRAVCTVLPHFGWRYRRMQPEKARDAFLAPPGARSVEPWAVLSWPCTAWAAPSPSPGWCRGGPGVVAPCQPRAWPMKNIAAR
jgi:hypothetical protein